MIIDFIVTLKLGRYRGLKNVNEAMTHSINVFPDIFMPPDVKVEKEELEITYNMYKEKLKICGTDSIDSAIEKIESYYKNKK